MKLTPDNLELESLPQRILFSPYEPDHNLVRDQRYSILYGDFDDGETLKRLTDAGLPQVCEHYVRIGELSTLFLDFGQAMNARVSMFDMCDAHSQEVYEMYHALFDQREFHEGDLRPRIDDKLDGQIGRNITYVTHLEIAPPARGAYLGLAALKTLMNVSTGADLVVVPNVVYLDSAKGSGTRRRSSLHKYFEKLGLVRLTPNYMGWNLERLQPPFPVK